MSVFLMEEMGLHVTVKLNPTLLGKDAVDGLLHDVLGYTEVETRAEDFEKDLQWPAGAGDGGPADGARARLSDGSSA